ncbi:MAG: DUF4405 domain-containing protein [Saprospiraceae bacterium]|nr:DUF4405 domain-containing protein [Saprospiraceae bacterium]
MKSKQVISLSIAFAFLALSLTGILLYIKQKTHEIEITHTVFGLCFIGFAIFHILNNWSSIRGYSYEKLKSAWSKEIKIVGIAFVVYWLVGLPVCLNLSLSWVEYLRHPGHGWRI